MWTRRFILPLSIRKASAYSKTRRKLRSGIARLRTKVAPPRKPTSLQYPYGRGVTQSWVEAAQWLHKAAEQGDITAENMLGVQYVNGLGVPRDYAEAVKWLRKAADGGNGMAVPLIHFLYSNGLGIAQDHDNSLNWYENPEVQLQLGHVYRNGDAPFQRNDTEAAKWYLRAADQGNASAQFQLGLLYANGQGVPEDHVSAHMWLSLAAAAGVSMAGAVRDGLAFRMTRDQIAEAERIAKDWKPTK